MVHEGVVSSTQQGEIVECVPPAVVLFDDVVDIAPGPVPIAAVELAVLIAALHGAALGPVEFGFGVGVVQNDGWA